MTFFYTAFDRRVLSERSIGLLRESSDNSPALRTDIVISWSEQPVDVDGPAVSGAPGSAIHGVLGEGGLWAILPGTGSVVWVPEDSLELTVHPHRTQGLENNHDGRRDVDSLVTGLLSRMPDRWGALPLHVAALSTPSGVVLISGKSGAGKSTLSQHLVKECGWVLLDDDSSQAQVIDQKVVITPLGGIPRLRTDAADELGKSGNQLPGFHNKKISLTPGNEQLPYPSREVSAFFSLEPRPLLSEHELNSPEVLQDALTIQQIVGLPAVVEASRAAVGLNRFALSWRHRRFDFAATLPAAAQFIISYHKGVVSPREIAARIHELAK